MKHYKVTARSLRTGDTTTAVVSIPETPGEWQAVGLLVNGAEGMYGLGEAFGDDTGDHPHILDTVAFDYPEVFGFSAEVEAVEECGPFAPETTCHRCGKALPVSLVDVATPTELAVEADATDADDPLVCGYCWRGKD